MLPRCWVLGHWHCWEWWRCYWLQSWGHCLHCCCCLAFQGGHRRKRSALEPGAGADYWLGWAWGWWGDWEPDAGWGAGAAAACRSSPPEAGDGSSCEHYGTWFYRTFWNEERGKRKTGVEKRTWISKPSVGSPWGQTQREFVLELPLVWLVLLTCHTACRGRSWPMRAQEPPPPVQTVCPLADRWALSMGTGPIVSWLTCWAAFHTG